jgi:hypothetical protein
MLIVGSLFGIKCHESSYTVYYDMFAGSNDSMAQFLIQRLQDPLLLYYRSVIVPLYMRRSPNVSEVLPLLYLHGLSSGDFVPALEEFFGSGAFLGHDNPSDGAMATRARGFHESRPLR